MTKRERELEKLNVELITMLITLRDQIDDKLAELGADDDAESEDELAEER